MTIAHTIRKTTILFMALLMISVPLLAAAGTSSGQAAQGSLANTEWNPEVSTEPEAVYGKLRAQSQQVCGSSDLKVAGGLTRSLPDAWDYGGPWQGSAFFHAAMRFPASSSWMCASPISAKLNNLKARSPL